MVVAQRKYEYLDVERQSIDLQSKPTEAPKKRVSIKPIQKCQIIACVLFICAICIGILLGYSQLAEIKFRINEHQKSIRKLEASIEYARVEIDSVQRLDLIEDKAVLELGMQYPRSDQMSFLETNVDQVGTSSFNEDINPYVQKSILVGVKETLQKFIQN